jgi:DNA mismatch repair protein MutL
MSRFDSGILGTFVSDERCRIRSDHFNIQLPVPDLINLLPDHIANQIAAGEVIQRPASAVKELLENAIDSGATEIKVYIKDAGKALIQVIDNGCGMSERDARVCFERHATSKIKAAEDLAAIRTLGFRGEALASIASISQVMVRSKRTEDETGTCVEIEGSEFGQQYPVTCSDGTSVAVKNLFFNVPARRNFLKSNQLELKYILDEFFRVALARPNTGFFLYHQDRLLYQLSPSTLKLRIVALFGAPYSERLMPVEQTSNIVSISGFIGKPEFARKTRGEQYFFTNQRFIKSAYLHHAVEQAFQELIPKDSFPTYFLFLDIDPASIDINIHPTKTEVNFQDSKSIYAILHAAVRQAIGKFTLAPSLDFETEKSFELPPFASEAPIRPPTIKVDPDYNPFEKKTRPQFEIPLHTGGREPDLQIKKIYDPLKSIGFGRNEDAGLAGQIPPREDTPSPAEDTEILSQKIFQLQERFIVTHIKSGIVIIDQQCAHERILYERFLEHGDRSAPGSQHQLIPQQVHIHPSDMGIIEEYRDLLAETGFEASGFGKDTLLISAIPSGVSNEDIPGLFEKVLELLKTYPEKLRQNRKQVMAASMAKAAAIPRGRKMQPEEMIRLAEQLFTCKAPEQTPDGKPTMILVGYGELGRKFK